MDPVKVIGAAPAVPIPITVDQQEKIPVRFPPAYATVTVGHLKTFDYAVTGDTCWAIERKSIPDLVGSFTTHRAREIRKLERAHKQFDSSWPLVYLVEGSKRDLVSYDWTRHPKASPQWFISHLFAISQAYGIQFDFCATRQEFALWLYRWLKTRWKAIQCS